MNADIPVRAADAEGRAKRRRLFWMQQVRRWHWISSALCLIGLILFAGTGVTLNHAASIEAKPQVTARRAVAPASVRAALAAAPPLGKAAAPAVLRDWLSQALGADIGARPIEWSQDEAYVSIPRPGGDAALTIDRATGEASYERTSRGVIAVLNDLHKGRNAGPWWGGFIDVFAAACLMFAVTGLILLQMHAQARPITWPLVGAGLAAPLVIALVFVHL